MSRAPKVKLSDIASDTTPNGHGDPDDVLMCLHNGEWLTRQRFDPIEWAVERLIPEGLTFLVGAPKVGKSWLTYECALGVASGGHVLGQPVARRPVLHLALEDSHRRLKERASILGHNQLPATWEYIIAPPEGTHPVEIVKQWLERNNATRPVAIVDTLGKIRGGGKRSSESVYDYDYRIGSSLKRTIDAIPGAALVVIHHDRKAETADFIDSVSGTHGLTGAADTIIVVRRERNSPEGSILVTGRDVEEAGYAAVFDAGRWRLDGDSFEKASASLAIRAETEGIGGTMRDIVTYVNTYPEAVNAKDVALALNIDEHTARTYLARASKDDRISKDGRGRYSASHRRS